MNQSTADAFVRYHADLIYRSIRASDYRDPDDYVIPHNEECVIFVGGENHGMCVPRDRGEGQ